MRNNKQNDINSDNWSKLLPNVAVRKSHLFYVGYVSQREHILGEMNKALKDSRKEFSKHTPKMEIVKVDKKDIATVIGKGGATIREIVETSGAKVDVKDTGEVTVAAPDEESRNKAITYAKGDYIAFLDDDDFFTEEGVQALISALDSNPSFVFGHFNYIFPNETSYITLSHVNNDLQLIANNIPVGAYAIKKSLILSRLLYNAHVVVPTRRFLVVLNGVYMRALRRVAALHQVHMAPDGRSLLLGDANPAAVDQLLRASGLAPVVFAVCCEARWGGSGPRYAVRNRPSPRRW